MRKAILPAAAAAVLGGIIAIAAGIIYKNRNF